MRAVGSRQGEAIALWNLSKVARLQGDYLPAERFARDSLAIAQQIGDQYAAAGAQLMLGDALLQLGRIPEAEQACSAAVELNQAMNQQHLADEAQAGLARVDLVRGDPEAARARLTTLIDYILQGGMLEGVEDLLLILLTCCEVLQATADTRAVPMVELSYQELIRRADTIPDAPTRERFLTQVPYHRAILHARANGRPGS
jgi:tetratricopeptide (TPR) repeat protein